MLVILSDILDSVTVLGGARAFLPTHYSYAWLDALSPTVSWDAMIRGVVSSFAYSLVFFALAWRRFLRKDITSQERGPMTESGCLQTLPPAL